MIIEGHYIEPDRTIDPTPASHLERTLRPDSANGSLLVQPSATWEKASLAAFDDSDDDAVA